MSGAQLMVEIILVRHGETDWNNDRRFQGQVDLPLNKTGLAQGKALAEQLKNEKFDRLITSSLQRAKVTAEMIVDANPNAPQLEVDPRLIETGFGEWEGLDHETIKNKYPGQLDRWHTDPDFIPPQGESFSQTMSRLDGFLVDLYHSSQDQRVLLVAHGCTFQSLICQAMRIRPAVWWPFMLYNASISEIWLKENGATLIHLNYVNHLNGLFVVPGAVSK